MPSSSLHREAILSDQHYSLFGSEYERSSKRFMREMVPNDKPLHILDMGCATGLNSSYFVKSGHSVVGLDISPVAVEKYRARGFEGHVCDVEREDLPVQPASFDLVYASEVIEHCGDTSVFLRKVSGVLKPGGILLLSTDNSAFWAYRVMALLGRTLSEVQHPGHVRFFSKRSLAKAITDAGFQIDRISARHMYLILGKSVPTRLMSALGFMKEPRYATKDYFWQISAFAQSASPFWADCLIVSARKT